MFYTGVKKMNKKIFIILFFLFALISVSAVSAADLDDSNETVALSEIGEGQIAVSNDVNAIDDLNKDDSGSEAVLGNAVKSSAAGEKEILGVENSGSDVLGATVADIHLSSWGSSDATDPNPRIWFDGHVLLKDGENYVGPVDKGTISVYLNNEFYITCDVDPIGRFNGEVSVPHGSYEFVLSYHDDDGNYPDGKYIHSNLIEVGPKTWYVNGSRSITGQGTSEASPFITLKQALNWAKDYDIVKIAAGTYTGSDNIGLTVDKNLTFEKYGDGEAIFDAQGQGRILDVNANSMNITGLTFKNGKVSGPGAAISFNSKLSNSVIIAKFINNSAVVGGAIYVGDEVSNSVINSTFENNNATNGGGAIYFPFTVSDSLINSTFKNNSAQRGGAIRFDGTFTKSNLTSVFINNIASLDGGANCFNSVDNVNIIGDFINNTAKGSGECGGGANAFYDEMTNVSISGNFIGNSATGSGATDGGAANYFFKGISNVNITGKFINNTGNNVIYIFYSDSGNNNIHDSVFLNNKVKNQIIYVDMGQITAKDNWFGNNQTNFMNEPENVGIDLVNWLWLYAEPPFMFDVGQSSQITFELFVFNSNYGYPYDASKMNITLDLSQTLGELDKTSALIGEKITYTAKEAGSATVTGKFETASNTVSFTINDPKIPTEIKIANSTVNLKANDEIESGATLTPADAGNVTYTSMLLL